MKLKKDYRLSNSNAILYIKVEMLFGYYTYVLQGENLSKSLNQLAIFYGDNGVGKSTILNMIFYLLNSTYSSGCKSQLAKIKFKSFVVRLANDFEIHAVRKGSNLIGSFDFFIRGNNIKTKRIFLRADDQNVIQVSNDVKTESVYKEVLEIIGKLNIKIFYITDDREIMNSLTYGVYDGMESLRLNPTNLKLSNSYFNERFEEKIKKKQRELLNAVENFDTWIKNKVYVAANKGDKNTNAIYTDLIKKIANPIEKEKYLVKIKKDELVNDIRSLEQKSLVYEKLGLLPAFRNTEVVSLIDNLSGEKLKTVLKILEPYVEGLKTKLEILSKYMNIISSLKNIVDQYFINKKISYTMQKGLVIRHSNNEVLDLTMLSSGETQLLNLLLNTIIASDEATLFIIDEPEISLNVKWQRKLLETLLNFNQDGKIQFLIATHSIELLSSYDNNVLRLVNLNDKKNGRKKKNL